MDAPSFFVGPLQGTENLIDAENPAPLFTHLRDCAFPFRCSGGGANVLLRQTILNALPFQRAHVGSLRPECLFKGSVPHHLPLVPPDPGVLVIGPVHLLTLRRFHLSFLPLMRFPCSSGTYSVRVLSGRLPCSSMARSVSSRSSREIRSRRAVLRLGFGLAFMCLTSPIPGQFSPNHLQAKNLFLPARKKTARPAVFPVRSPLFLFIRIR